MLRAISRRSGLLAERVSDALAPLPSTWRLWSALPQPACDPEYASEHSAAANQEAEAYRRRLEEMERGHWQQGPPPRRRRHRRPVMPTPQEVAQQLKQQQQQHGGGCSSAESSTSSSNSSEVSSSASAALDWREVVAAMRAAQQALSGEQMLTDSFGRKHTYLRISLTERCNLRCLYCMPEEGADLTPQPDLLNTDEVLRLAGLFVGAGVDKVRLTGGEPTLRKDLPEIVGRLNELPGLRAIGLTTNGVALERKLPLLKANGLSLLNLSLDTLRPERFEAMTRRRGHDRVLRALQCAEELSFDPLKLNVVVMRGVNDDEIADFVELTRHRNVNVRFIEYMPFDGNVWSGSKLVSYADMLAAVTAAYPQGLERCLDPRGEVAKNFRVPGFRGTVSFVTSMTKAFCSDCNRLRVMADGNLKVCLFGANEVSLRDAMREGASDDDLRCIVSAAVDRKRAAHAGMFELAKAPNRAMVRIGG